MQRVKMQNPGPASLVLINPKRGKTMAARKRRASTTRRRRRAVSNPRRRRRSTVRVRARRTTSHLRAPARRRRTRRRNPLFATKRRRHSVSRRRNPVSGAIGQAIPLVGASFAITFAAPIVTRFVGGFLPLGQFTQPVVLAGTGYGLGWLAGKLGFGKYKGPLEIMGVTLGLTALVAPYLRGFLAPSQPAQQNGLNGPYRNRYARGMNGIAAVSAVPPLLMGAPPVPAHGMNGIAANSVPGRF
jgi:hypothetical protein